MNITYLWYRNLKPEFMTDLYKNKYRIPSARAQWHCYNVGCYFITICTDKREHFFGEVKDTKMFLSEIGEYVESNINKISQIYRNVSVLSHVVMPNHIHLIIAIDYDNTKCKLPEESLQMDKNEMMQEISNRCGRLSHIISVFKSTITKYARANDIYFMWQSRFHDRIIRDFQEYVVISDYIENNVNNWRNDEYF